MWRTVMFLQLVFFLLFSLSALCIALYYHYGYYYFFYYYYYNSLNIVQQSNHIIHALSICGQWTLYYNLHALVAHILCAACKRKCLRHGVCALYFISFRTCAICQPYKTEYENHKIKCSTQLLIVHFWTVKREEKQNTSLLASASELCCCCSNSNSNADIDSNSSSSSSTMSWDLRHENTRNDTTISAPRHAKAQPNKFDRTMDKNVFYNFVIVEIKKNIKNWVSRQQCTLRRAHDHKPASQPTNQISKLRQAGRQASKKPNNADREAWLNDTGLSFHWMAKGSDYCRSQWDCERKKEIFINLYRYRWWVVKVEPYR